AERGRSSVPLGLGFRALARLGAFQPFIDHQRLVHTFVTNVRGPRVPWHVGGRPVTSVVPVAVTPGNVGVSFDVLSYAGRLTVSVVADPAVVPDQDALTASLAGELDHVSGSRDPG
ncbi:MAG TPA: WS/DGAT domain-containing protein, partial [Humibacillus xanthopallidus]|nr:WS/DGAT domain-containing protein [Humibacillus xanthopallidus]